MESNKNTQTNNQNQDDIILEENDLVASTDNYIKGGDNMNHLYLSILVNCEKLAGIKVTVKSHDQGWASYETGGSWTWGEIGILDSEGKEKYSQEERKEVYVNGIANNQWQIHEKVIFEPAFLSKIEKGDKIGVWLRSRFSGWINYAEYGKIELFEEGLDIPKWLEKNYPAKEERAKVERIDAYGLKGNLDLSDFTQLEELNLYNSPEVNIENLSKVSRLSLRGSRLNNEKWNGNKNKREEGLKDWNGSEEIKGLKDLESIKNLTYLNIRDNNELTDLDLSSFSRLEKFDCDDKLKSLNISNCTSFKGNLKFLKDLNLNELESINITNTNISKGSENLPKSCKKLYCDSDYRYSSHKLIEELEKYGKCWKEEEKGKIIDSYYSLDKWRINKIDNLTSQLIPIERLFVIRSNIKKFVGKWSKKEDYDWYELNHWKKGEKGTTLSRLQNPNDFSKSWWVITGVQWVNRAVLVAGGSLVLVGQSDTENPNSQIYTQTGGVVSIVGPFVETVASYVNDQIYGAKQKKWDEFISDTENMLDNYHELLGILKQIEKKELGKINVALNNLRDKTEEFLEEYDKEDKDKNIEKNGVIDINELTNAVARKKFADNLSKEDKEKGGGSRLGDIVKAMKNLEEKITDYKQDKKKDNNEQMAHTEIIVQ